MKKIITLFKDLTVITNKDGNPDIEWQFNTICDNVLKKIKTVVLPTATNIDILRLIKIRSFNSPMSLIISTLDPNIK